MVNLASFKHVMQLIIFNTQSYDCLHDNWVNLSYNWFLEIHVNKFDGDQWPKKKKKKKKVLDKGC